MLDVLDIYIGAFCPSASSGSFGAAPLRPVPTRVHRFANPLRQEPSSDGSVDEPPVSDELCAICG